MGIKIRKFHIENFKVFQTFSVDLNDSDFIIFDGPNGFGKTTFFDAMELLLTGKIRRYEEWAKLATDGRESFTENPYLNSRRKDGDLIIKAVIEANGKDRILMRKSTRLELSQKTRISEFVSPLYELTAFEATEGNLVKNENDYLKELLGLNYRENFRFLHYVEQEENIALLKCKDRERKDAIDYLFNTLSFQNQVDKIKDSISKIGELCGAAESSRLEILKKEIEAIEAEMLGDIREVAYAKLFAWGDFDWDRQQVQFKEGQYASWIGEDGLLEKVKSLIGNIDIFEQEKRNRELDGLIGQEASLKQIILYSKHLNDVELYVNKLSIRQEIKRILAEFDKGTLKFALDKNVVLARVESVLSHQIDFKAYDRVKQNIAEQSASLNKFSEIVAKLEDSRSSFARIFTAFTELSKETECPMCGHDWVSLDVLKLQIEVQQNRFRKLTEESGKDLKSLVERFEAEFIIPIKKMLNDYLISNPIDEVFVAGLQAAVRNQSTLIAIGEQLRQKGIIVQDLDEPKSNLDSKLASLKKALVEQKRPLDATKIKPYFADIFLKFFNEKSELVREISIKDIDEKKEYIKWQYSLHQSKSLKDRKREYDESQGRFENASKMKDGLNKLKRIYEKSLLEYQRKIIADIEILFHLYSGRIVQDCQEGMGLFISDKNGIRFLPDPKKSYDAIFTMSSGQLAVLILAFTLTLNKRYSQNKMLFIDDPVQTLDELNISSLVDLLRNEFSDRQIFLSTHEDKMSAFMRYKFQKYGLNTSRLSFKDMYFGAADV